MMILNGIPLRYLATGLLGPGSITIMVTVYEAFEIRWYRCKDEKEHIPSVMIVCGTLES
jgi:hypothetical protein